MLFEQPFTGIEVDRALLSAQAVHRDQSVHGALTELAERRVEQLDQRPAYAARVRDLLVERKQLGGPAMTECRGQAGAERARAASQAQHGAT